MPPDTDFFCRSVFPFLGGFVLCLAMALLVGHAWNSSDRFGRAANYNTKKEHTDIQSEFSRPKTERIKIDIAINAQTTPNQVSKIERRTGVRAISKGSNKLDDYTDDEKIVFGGKSPRFAIDQAKALTCIRLRQNLLNL